jgi:hypothetical protein
MYYGEMRGNTYCLYPEIEEKLKKWVEQREVPAALLLGEPGVGKTTLAYRVLEQSGLKVVEFNASHTRSGTSFRKVILPLLREGGIIKMVESGKKGGIGILLDEIDGLSSGERGGLQELLAYLKSPDALQGQPVILISNTLDSRALQQIAKHCLTIEMKGAKKEILEEWLHRSIPDNMTTDLRALQRQLAGYEQPEENIEIPEGVVPVAWWALWHDWHPNLELDIENNEGNLASLISLENIPERIEAVKGDSEEGWKLYMSLFEAYRTSDQGDFWAFFYQCWNILPLSLQLKLKHISMRLTTEAPNPKKRLEVDDMRYTPVLTKQSAMFNAWKLLCEISETYKVPVRMSPMYAYKELCRGGIRPDRIRRLEGISLQKLYTNVLEQSKK